MSVNRTLLTKLVSESASTDRQFSAVRSSSQFIMLWSYWRWREESVENVLPVIVTPRIFNDVSLVMPGSGAGVKTVCFFLISLNMTSLVLDLLSDRLLLWAHNSLTLYSNYDSILCRFWNIQCRKMSWPWNRVSRQSRSLKVVPFHRLCMVSY